MAEQWEYALMAGRAYQSNRDKNTNWFPVPSGWSEIEDSHRTNPSGFEAVSFIKGDQIVISYTGTDPKSLGDLVTDLQLLTGNITVQLLQAAEYYMAVKASYPDATITLTGHSLGGGFAALMGVLFNKQAITFDQAPFAQVRLLKNAHMRRFPYHSALRRTLKVRLTSHDYGSLASEHF